MDPGANTVLLVMAGMMLLIMLLFLVSLSMIVRPWLRGFLGGVPISLVQVVGMRLRGTPPMLVVDALLALVHRGHAYDSRLAAQVESTWLAKRGLIQSPEQLADLVEKERPAK